jgi:hypothetical protein
MGYADDRAAVDCSNASYFIENKWPFKGRRSSGYRFASYGFFGERTRFLLNRCAVPNSPTALRRNAMNACVSICVAKTFYAAYLLPAAIS